MPLLPPTAADMAVVTAVAGTATRPAPLVPPPGGNSRSLMGLICLVAVTHRRQSLNGPTRLFRSLIVSSDWLHHYDPATNFFGSLLRFPSRALFSPLFGNSKLGAARSHRLLKGYKAVVPEHRPSALHETS